MNVYSHNVHGRFLQFNFPHQYTFTVFDSVKLLETKVVELFVIITRVNVSIFMSSCGWE